MLKTKKTICLLIETLAFLISLKQAESIVRAHIKVAVVHTASSA